MALAAVKWKVQRARFLLLGIGLFAAKSLIDHAIARMAFGRDWSPVNYLMPTEVFWPAAIAPDQRFFYFTMLLVALPFVVIGLNVTRLRLIDAGLPLWLLVLFFPPVINLLFFAVLSLLPTTRPSEPGEPESSTVTKPQAAPPAVLQYGVSPVRQNWLTRLMPSSEGGSLWASVGVTALLGVAVTLVGVRLLGNYGWGLFLGGPFAIGLIATMLFTARSRRSLAQCLGVSVLATAATGAASIAFAIEGLGCLIMFLPLAVPLALLGGALGHAIQRRTHAPTGEVLGPLLALLISLPVLMGAESLTKTRPPLIEVSTAVEIDATPTRVWEHVVTFRDIPRPKDWIFRAGVAYPVRAEIVGRGVGAVRYCEFSTGAFVEPITRWDEGRLLSFDVTHNPPAMREWSPFNIHPPHVQGFLVSERGQFELIAIDGGRRTLLRGTTWYRHDLWPAAYWRLWSDHIIHRIHHRVLTHVKELSEKD